MRIWHSIQFQNYLKENLSFFILLIALIIITVIITYIRINVQIGIGPIWDTFDYLTNASYFAGQGFGYMDLTRPPFLSFLTSLFFRLGYVSELTIFYVDGALFIFSIIGLYLFLNLRFNHVISFLGSLLFVTFPVVIWWVGVGYTDLASVSFSIWALYFIVLAVKKNSKFFYLCFLFAMFAFLTRYNSALIIFPMGLYLLINRKHIRNLKDLSLGISISILPLVLVLTFFNLKFGNPFYPFISFVDTAQQPALTEHFAYNPDLLYFIRNLPFYIGGSIGIVLIILLGSILKIIQINELKFKLLSGIKEKENISVLIILISIFVITFGKINYMASEILFFISCVILYNLLKNFKNIDIDLMFLVWFMVFFIFHSVYAIKEGRYFILMAPAFLYILILGLDKFFEVFIKNKKTLKIFSIILIFALILSSFNYLYNIIPNEEGYGTKDVLPASKWLENYDPAYKTKIIYADNYWPHFSWYLKMNVTAMPLFEDGNAYYCELKEYYPNSQDNIAYNNELERNKVDYYFCIRPGLNLTSYKSIKQFGTITIYQRIG